MPSAFRRFNTGFDVNNPRHRRRHSLYNKPLLYTLAKNYPHHHDPLITPITFDVILVQAWPVLPGPFQPHPTHPAAFAGVR